MDKRSNKVYCLCSDGEHDEGQAWEAALFAAELAGMYRAYAAAQGWSVRMLAESTTDLGGYKDVSVAVKARGTTEIGEAPYDLLKFEGGVHRVQRVPATETQGRIHTSACTVAVLAEPDEAQAISINPSDLSSSSHLSKNVAKFFGPTCSIIPTEIIRSKFPVKSR